jgi:transcriptional regulator with XRE-family HTH domain
MNSTQPFPEALHDLVRAKGYRKRNGTVNYAEVANALPTITYETLRKLTSGAYPPSPAQLEEIAGALDVDPAYFAEYQLWLKRRPFDPREVGIDEALKNLRAEAMGGDGAADRRQKRRSPEERPCRPLFGDGLPA